MTSTLSRRFRVNAGIVLVALCVGLGLATTASAQTISQTVGTDTFNPVFGGQSFTATLTGTVTQIAVRPTSDVATTLSVYDGTGTGAAGGAGVPVSSQAVNLVTTLSPDFQIITLDTPLPVTAGQTYSFAVNTGSLAASQAADPYPDGVLFSNGTTTIPAADAVFQIYEVVTPTAVPTLSEWAMILFGLVLAGSAALLIRRRQVVA